jgi:dihydropteroate synthase
MNEIKNRTKTAIHTLNCKGKLLVLDEPKIMGILNITPDSFYEESRLKDVNTALKQAEKMIEEGADILDIGGQSTRPGSERIHADEELQRVAGIIRNIHERFPETIISIDTYHAKVATEAVAMGASMVNDISGADMDEKMIGALAEMKNVPYICMHMQGRPETMQNNPQYENVTREVLDFFILKTDQLQKAGIHDVIIDPGFGFGKSLVHNFELLNHMDVLQLLNRPILAGLSRKASIYKTLGITAAEALNGTTAMNMVALIKGAHILRVHDVKEAKQVCTLYKALIKN